MTLFGQVGLPDPTQPADDSLWGQIFGPLMPLVSDFWYIVLHFFLPAALVMGVLVMILGAMMGSRMAVARGRGMLMTIPMAVILVSAAVIVSNWAIGAW